MLKALSKDSKARYASCGEFVDALESPRSVSKRIGLMIGVTAVVFSTVILAGMGVYRKHTEAKIAEAARQVEPARQAELSQQAESTRQAEEKRQLEEKRPAEEKATDKHPEVVSANSEIKTIKERFRLILAGSDSGRNDALKSFRNEKEASVRNVPSGTVELSLPGGGKIHLVALDVSQRGKWITRSAVSQGQWHGIFGVKPSYRGCSEDPVTNVSWEDCQGYVSRLNKLGKYKFRLPNESELKKFRSQIGSGMKEWCQDAYSSDHDDVKVALSVNARFGYFAKSRNKDIGFHLIAEEGK